MALVNVRREIAAPADAVWAAIGEMAHASEWPAVETCEIEGRGTGCVRKLRLTDGAVIHERVEEHDDGARRYRSEVFVLGQLPVQDYHYSVSVCEIDAERCTIDWRASFEPVGVSEEHACHLIEGLYLASTMTIVEEIAQ